MLVKIIRYTLLTLTITIIGLVIIVAVTPQGNAAFKTLMFVPQVLPSIPIKPQEWITDKPIRETIQFPTSMGQESADLYTPSMSGEHPAILFFFGVVPPDRNDKRIVELAEALSRSGIVVMIPWLNSQTENRIAPEDIDNLVQAFQYLSSHPAVDSDRIAMSGICTGASLSLIAASDTRIQNQVLFVNFFAGYYDAFDIVRALGSRSRFYGETTKTWTPDKLTLRIFTKHIIEGVEDVSDKEILTQFFIDETRSHESEPQPITKQGKAVHKILKGTTVNEIDLLIQHLSPNTIEFLKRISPKSHLKGVKTRVLIMHDTEDKLVPSEESRRLADALKGNVYFTEFSFFQDEIQVHVDGSTQLSKWDFITEGFKLYLHIYQIFRNLE